MNRNYKVIWNASLNCFMAVSEYAKARGKSSKSSVSANATINTTSNLLSTNAFRLTAIGLGLGLLAAGFSIPASANNGTSNHHDGTYSHSHGSHGTHTHTNGNNSHNNPNGPGNLGSSISLNFEGDNPKTITRTNGQTLNILGGASGNLTTNNIGVFGSGDSLHIQLAENLTGLTSVTTGNSLLNTSGLAITGGPTFTKARVDVAGNKITGVASGVGNDSNAANIGDVNNAVAANKTKYYSVKNTSAAAATGPGSNVNNDGATKPNAMAMGVNASATGGQAIAIGSGDSGQNTTASGEQSIAIGANVESSGHSSIAIGGDDLDDASKTAGVNDTFKYYTGNDLIENSATPYTRHTKSDGAASIAIGVKAQSEGYLSTAVGVRSSSSGDASSAFGMGSSATREGSLALGAGSRGEAVDGVALGSKSVANRAATGSGAVFVPTGANNARILATMSTTGAVSVGRAAAENQTAVRRQITNVAAGTEDSDAVNVAQLSSLSEFVEGGLNFTGDDTSAVINRQLGDTLTIKGGAPASALTAGNIGVVREGDTLSIKLAEDIDLGPTGSVTITNTDSTKTVSLTNTGLNNGGNKITNVASGVGNDSNAANIGDLNTAVAANKTKYYSVKNTSAPAATGPGSNEDNDGAIKPNAMAMGVNAKASGGQAIAIGSGDSGQHTTASGEQSIAIGANVQSSGHSSIAIGGDDLDDASKVGGVNALFDTYTGGTGGLVTVGDYSGHTKSDGAASVAIGVKAHSEGNLSTAVGVRSSSLGDASSAFGMGSSASKKGSVALGAGSVANRDGGFAAYTGGATGNALTAINSTIGRAELGAVSVGPGGEKGTRQIINVAAGSFDNDAVNVAQLKGVDGKVNKGLNFSGDRGAVINRQLGDTLNIKGGAASTATLTNSNIGIRNDGSNGLIVELADKVNLGTNGSVNIGNTQVKSTGITIAGSALSNTVVLNNNGLNNGGFKVVNVDKGNVSATSADAINGSQLFGTAQSIANNFGGGSIVNPDGTVSTPVYQVNGNDQTGVAGAIAELDKGFSVETNGAAISTVKAGDTIDIGTAAGETNIEVAKTGNVIDFKLADNIKLTSVTTGNSVLNNNGLTIVGGPSFTATGINAGNQQITGVLSGGVLTDVNNQLNAANIGDVKNAIGGVTTLGFGIKAADNNTVQKNLGEVVEIIGSNSNITTTAASGKVKVVLNNNLDLNANGSVKMGSSSSLPHGLGPVTTIDRLGMITGNAFANTSIDLTGVTVASPLGITNLNSTGLYVVGGPSVTRSGIDAGSKKITNVKAGSNPLDAVNYSQLETTNEAVNRGLDFTGDNTGPTSVITRKSGQLLKTTGGNTDLTNLSDDNIGVIADNNANTLTVKLAKDLTGLNSASFGNDIMISSDGLKAGTTVINTSGVSFSGSAVGLNSSGLNNGGNKITGVLAAEFDDEAVNYGQLKEVKQSAADANKGWNISAQGANASTVKPSDTVDLNNTDNNITVSKTAESNEITFNLNENITVSSVKTGDATLNSDGLNIAGGPKFTKTAIDAAGNKITNVANGLVAFESKEAINGGQLQEVITVIQSDAAVLATQMGAGLNFDADSGPVINKKAGSDPLSFKGGNNIKTTAEGSSIKFDLNGNINVESVTTGNTTVNNSGVTIKNGPSMTAAGIYAGNAETAPSMTAAGINAAGTKVTNVADGMAPRDAVNFGQLDAVSKGLGNSINELGYKIGEVEDDANAGISAAMAMSSLPQAFISGKPMIGGGIATYNGESAVAIGFSKMSNDGRWVMKLNGTADTQGNVGAAIGAGFHFD